MTIKENVQIDENGDEFVEYCVEINGAVECFETEEEADEALKRSQPKAPGMRG